MKRFIALLLTSLSVNAAYAVPGLQAMDPANDPVIYTITTTTPGGTELKADEERIFAGTSCSSMTVVDDFHSFGDDYVSVVAKTKGLTSTIVTEIAGPERGCFQVDILYNNKTISTGPVQLFWDNDLGHYIGATPSSGVMHFD